MNKNTFIEWDLPPGQSYSNEMVDIAFEDNKHMSCMKSFLTAVGKSLKKQIETEGERKYRHLEAKRQRETESERKERHKKRREQNRKVLSSKHGRNKFYWYSYSTAMRYYLDSSVEVQAKRKRPREKDFGLEID